MSDRLVRRAGSVLVSVAMAVTLLALAVAPFLNPAWLALAQDRADAAAWTGFTEDELGDATGRILADLLTGGDFVIHMASGVPLLQEREIAHMQDVQRVFALFGLLALGAAVALVVLRRIGREPWWSAVRAGALGLAAGIVVVGAVGLLAFELAFEVFHRLFFAGGTYAFDPRTDRLVQLFPLQLWFETAIAVGVVALVLSLLVAALATRRLRVPGAAPTPMAARLEAAR